MNGFDCLGLKAELLVEGIRATPEALKEVGQRYKEQNHGLFGWDFEDHVGMVLPDDFVLPDGTVVQFRKNSRSPYQVTEEGHGLDLLKGRERICSVKWIPRPAYYNRDTVNDHKMVKIGQIGGEDCLFFCYQNYCSHFSKKEECLFCNLVSTSKTYNSVLKRKETEDIGEVAGAAFAEGRVNHVLLTGGCFNHQKEIQLVADILGSIRKQTGLDRIPGTILPSPPKGGDEIKRYYETGIKAIGFSMEIWDEKLYQGICPGKSKEVGHAEFLHSIHAAVHIFGEGNVYGIFVMGLEPRKTFLEGVREMTSLGANVVPFVWSPNPGSQLEGHRAPASQWFVDTILEASEIVYNSGVPPGTGNHCYRCDGNSLLHDALRLRGIQ
ncbi:MAG: radical SAM protein [Deltaproteobacteria bacterium RBG_16_48_10]|nr:MAG: radical SAM protein [Deltaproteobacteria bacterium RBG_16_48_10]